MSKPFLSRKMQRVYSIAEIKLDAISTHPDLVEKGAIGFFMSVENIKKRIRSFDPVDWYKGEKYNKENLSFNDLPKEDQNKLITVLEELTKSISQDDLEDNCRACSRLADEFGNKILARSLNDEDKKLSKITKIS